MAAYLSRSPEDTEEYGRSLAERLAPGQTVALYGDLGAGKTALVRGILKGLGYGGTAASPTFPIACEYLAESCGIRFDTVHFDMYRIHTEEELLSTGFYDYLSDGFLTLIEWSENIPFAVEDSFLKIRLSRGRAENEREILVGGGLTC